MHAWHWEDFLGVAIQEDGVEEMRRHERTGRPLGSERFIKSLEDMLGRILKPEKAGRKPKNE